MPEVQTRKIDFGGPRSFTVAVHGALRRQGLSGIAARLVTAHIALSTGWGRSVYNYGLAGIKASRSWRVSRPYVVTRGCECREGYPDTNDPNCICGSGKGQFRKAMYWRAYSTLDEGVADVVAVLKQPRYSLSWALLQAGNPEYFAQVGRDGWYTADPTATKVAMMRFYNQINEYLGESGNSGIVAMVVAGAVTWLLMKG